MEDDGGRSGDDGTLEAGRRILAQQPFSRMVGTELVAWGDGAAELQLPIATELTQQHGFVHGGVVAYLADNALAFAGGSNYRMAIVTGEFKINFVRPAVGEVIVARATTVAASKRQAVVRCEVSTVARGEEKLCAVAQGTIVVIG